MAMRFQRRSRLQYHFIHVYSIGRGLGGLVISALDLQQKVVGSNPEKIFRPSVPSLYSMCLGLGIKWTGLCLVTDNGTKYAWLINESKVVQAQITRMG